MLGVIGAMEEEVRLLRAEMKGVKEAVHADITIARGKYKGAEIALAQSGIGKVNATICTQLLIDHYKPKKMLFSGVAGGLLPNMQAGDIIIASHVVQYDMDLTAFGRRRGETPGRDRLIECDPDLVGKATTAFDGAYEGVMGAPNLMLGTIASGDRFVQDIGTMRWLQREFAALATEMEGAAFGYTCHLNGLPFAVIRALSDGSGDGASDDFEDNLHQACQNTFRMMDLLIPAAMKDRGRKERRKGRSQQKSKLADFLEAKRLLGRHGSYDTSIAGAIGEAYAEEILGMEKAEVGTRGYDGWWNGRKIQVKTKAPEDYYPSLNDQYAAIRNSNHGIADDLLVVMIDPGDNTLSHLGPRAIDDLDYHPTPIERRYPLGQFVEE